MPRAALLNRGRLALGQRLDLSPIERLVELTVHEDVSGDAIATAAEGCAVLITKEVGIGADLMRKLRGHREDRDGIRLICEAGTGFNNLDLPAARELGITVCNVPGYSTSSVAQLTMSLLLGAASGTLGFVRRTARHDWHDFTGNPGPSFEVEGKTLGVIGFGAIGQAVAHRARAFGMQVLTRSRTVRASPDPGIRDASLDELLARSDFVSLHCPLAKCSPPAGTWHLIDAAALAGMKSEAWLLNVSRGGLVDELALAAALDSGKLAGAALDVHELEPAEPRPELKHNERVFLTPHVGWKAAEARARLIAGVAENIAAFQSGRVLNQVT